ncbi:alpha-D-ribose 1-methylphosphonate 5-triphosphate diphosphatase [Humibacter soli]
MSILTDTTDFADTPDVDGSTDIAGTTAPSSDLRSGWPLDRTPSAYVVTDVRVVLGDRVTDRATVVVENGRIAEVIEGSSGIRGDLDGNGLLLMPGLVDTHSDALEKERMPRPTATLPWDFAMASFEAKIAAAGVTTMFHGAGFHNKVSDGARRTPFGALEQAELVDATTSVRVDHRVLHRFNVRADEGAAMIKQRIEGLPADKLPIQLSHEDHTPGQGQYADIQHHIDFLVAGGEDRDEATRRVQERIAEARATDHIRDANLAWAGELARTGKARLLGHDCDSPEAIDELVERGGVIAEFPTTMEAARRARERGLLIVAGAPNLLRGGSHSGNVSAVDLVREGLVDAIASDYLPSGLLGCVTVVVRDRLLDLPHAVALVTSGGAAVGGLTDRGRIERGLRADFALVDDTATWPRVVTTLFANPE